MSPASQSLEFLPLEFFSVSKRKNSKRSKQRAPVVTRPAICTYMSEFTGPRHQTRGNSILSNGSAAPQRHAGLPSLISELESKVRNGNAQARHELIALIPITAISHVYSVEFKHLSTFNINSCPDIFPQILQATMMHTEKEDTLITFLRSTIPVLNNHNKIHRDITWPISHETSLKILIRCCLPTLLSLYPMPNTKDVCFDLRVSLFRFVIEILQDSHERRVKFVIKYKAIIRLCIVEYVFYNISKMPNLPRLPKCDPNTWHNVYSAASNTGQHFRVDMNTEYTREQNLETLLDRCRARAQVLYDRNVRVSKTARRVMQKLVKNNKSAPDRNPNECQTWSSTGIQAFVDYAQILHTMPRFGNFQVAEMYFRRNNVPMSEISRVWDFVSSFKTFPLPMNVVLRQQQALFETCEGSTQKMDNLSSILVCILCSIQVNVPSFRRCVNTGTFCCSRCNNSSSVFKINMVGRVLYINKIPFVLSICCSKIVVWSGIGYEFCRHSERQLFNRHFSCSELHMTWSEQTNMSFAQTLVRNTGIGSFMVLDLKQKPKMRRKIFLNNDLTVRDIKSPQANGLKTTCSVCKSTNVYASHELLNVQTSEIVLLQTCYKHAVHKKYEKYCLYTMYDYIKLVNEK